MEEPITFEEVDNPIYSIVNKGKPSPAQESWVVHYPSACFIVESIYLEKC